MKREPEWLLPNKGGMVVAGGLLAYRFNKVTYQYEVLVAQEKSSPKRPSFSILSGKRKRPTDKSPQDMAIREFLDEVYVKDAQKLIPELQKAIKQELLEPLVVVEDDLVRQISSFFVEFQVQSRFS